MSSIRILHASDLHIAIADQRRSFLDAAKDAIWATFNLKPRLIWTAVRKISLASSYDTQVLADLAELIVNNAKNVKADVLQYPEKVARKANVVFLTEKLDAIILTGDLATTGLTDDLKRVNSFLTAEYDPDVPHRPKDLNKIEATLAGVDSLKTPIACLPGNHDRYWFPAKLPTYLPGSRNFDSEVSDYSTEPVHEIPVLSSGSNLQLVILTADFTLQRFRDQRLGGWIAQGRVYYDGAGSVLSQLVSKTERVKREQQPDTSLCILWAVHFPPKFPGQRASHGLIDEDKLLEMADKLGVNGILAGHTHYQKRYRNTNPKECAVYCCGTSAQHDPKTSVDNLPIGSSAGNWFQILTITAEANGTIAIECEGYQHGVTAGTSEVSQRHWRKQGKCL